MELGKGRIRILDVGPRLQIPTDAPFHVRLAALACAYAIEELAFSVRPQKRRDCSDIVATIDRVITEQRTVFEGQGWRLHGVVELSDGSRGWELVRRSP
jgi:hypothetical protein